MEYTEYIPKAVALSRPAKVLNKYVFSTDENTLGSTYYQVHPAMLTDAGVFPPKKSLHGGRGHRCQVPGVSDPVCDSTGVGDSG